MNYLTFRENLLPFEVFSTRDVAKIFPDFDSRRLFEWKDKKYLVRLINKWYLFAEVPIDDMIFVRISNCLCRPSYVSLESALSYYHLIPEGVFSLQAMTTLKTISYTTPVGLFHYRSIKPEFFFGYRIFKNKLPLLMAEVEKAILDYLYLHSHIKSAQDLEATRFNTSMMKEIVNWNKLTDYASVFKSFTLDKRIKYLKKIILNAYPS